MHETRLGPPRLIWAQVQNDKNRNSLFMNILRISPYSSKILQVVWL
jgi:hypothetical protein